jgi:hypothetical protein
MPRTAKRSPALKAVEPRAENRPEGAMLSWAPARLVARVGARGSGSPAARREAASIAEEVRTTGEVRAGSAPSAPTTPKSAPPRKGQTGPRPVY